MTTRYSQYDPRPPSPTRTIYASQIQAAPQTQKVVYVQPSPAPPPSQVVYVQQAPQVVQIPVEESPKRERKVVKPKQSAYTPPKPKVVQQAPEEKSKYSCPRNFLWILPLVLAIVGILLGSLIIDRHNGKQGLDEANKVLSHLASHLRLPTFDKIKQLASTGTTPDGFTELPLGNYPGVQDGCICPDGKVYSKSRCYTDKHSCQATSGLPKAEFSKWKGNSKIVKKDGGPIKLATDSTCPAPSTSCFAPHTCCTGTPLAKITRPVGGLLRNLKIKHEKQNQPSIQELFERNNHLPYTIPAADNSFGAETGTTTLAADNAHLPFVEITTSLSRNICWNREVRDIPSNGKFYPLENNLQKGCGEYGAVVSQVLDTYQLRDLYNDNGLLTQINALPYYSNYGDDNNLANLVAIRRTNMCTAAVCDQVCRDIHPDQIEKIAHRTHSLLEHLHNVAIAVVVFGSVIIFICIIYIILRKAQVSALNEQDSIIFQILFFLGLVLAILCIVFGSYYLYHLNSDDGLRAHQKELEAYISKNCFADANLNQAINQYITQIQDFDRLFHTPILVLFWISIAWIIVSIIALALRWSERPANFFEKPF